MAKVHNFSAGPCILPQEVFKEASQSVLDFDNLGLSILEISHRSENFVRVMEEARELVKELLNIPKGYTVLFLQGGASTGFLMAPYNLLTENGTAGYMNTGTWSTKAIKEAKKMGNVDVIVSSEDENFKYIPKDIQIPSGLDYVHYTANNTIYGTQFKKLPQTDNFLVCDMSSDIFSRPVTINAYDIIYAGAQKNIGPAGTTMYIVNEEVFNKSGRDIPSMLDFEVHHKKDSMFNTPSVFAVYVTMLNLRYMKANGGVEAMKKKAQERSEMIYNEIDENPLFEGYANKEDRSSMNATFTLTDESYKEKFDKLWKEANINGIKGHRSIGGYRASMYNALPIESVEALVNVMKKLRS